MRVVSELVSPFAGLNHVVYCDNFYSSEDKVLFAGELLKSLLRSFQIKSTHPEVVMYLKKLVLTLVFQDRKKVCFVTNTRIAR